ncbi:glutathione S-transferase family protein [Neisseriaceae bacterium CLB008]
MSTMTLYTNPHSRGVTVSWMLAECGQTHEYIPLAFKTEMKSAEYLKLNPAGKVPTLVHDDIVISETAAIVAYLADLHLDKKLAPSLDNPLRGEYYKWLFIICNQFEPAMTDVKYKIKLSDEMRFALGYPELSVLEKQVTDVLSKRPYLLGKDFSAVDIMLVALLAAASEYTKIMPLNDVLAAYYQKAITRPAFIEAQKLNTNMAKEMGL